jgi:hypothetical protein
MNNRKKMIVGFSAALSMMPFYTHATSGQIGLEACADALVDELSTTRDTVVQYQLDSANEGFERKLGSRETFSLYARHPQSSELVSRMDCVVDGKGRVIRLTTVSLEPGENANRVSKAD